MSGIIRKSIASIANLGRPILKFHLDGTSSLAANIYYSTTTMVGSGIVALPYVTQKVGLPLGLTLTVISALLMGYTSYILTLMAIKEKTASFQDIIDKNLGTFAGWIHFIFNIILPLVLCIAYTIAITDNISRVLEAIIPMHTSYKEKLLIMSIFLIIMAFPVSLLDDLSFFRKISILSVISVIVYLTVFIIRAPEMSSRIVVLPEHWTFGHPGVPQALGALSLSFSVHHGILHLFESLKNNTIGRFCFSINASVMISSILYMTVICTGFISFTGLLESNVINNYCVEDKAIIATRILFATTLMSTFPLPAIFIRESLFNSLSTRINFKFLKQIIVFFLIILIFIAAGVARSIGPIVEFGGSLSGAPINMVFPSLVYIRILYDAKIRFNGQILFNWLVVIFGISLTLLGTTMSVIDYIYQPGTVNGPKYWCDEVLSG